MVFYRRFKKPPEFAYTTPPLLTVRPRTCLADGEPAIFHRWAEEDKGLLKINAFTMPDEQAALHRRFTDTGVVPNCCSVETLRNCFALVEYPDGSVGRVKPELIRFTDRQEAENGKE